MAVGTCIVITGMINVQQNIERVQKDHRDLRRFFDGWIAIWHKSDERFFYPVLRCLTHKRKIRGRMPQLRRTLTGVALSLLGTLVLFIFPAETGALSKRRSGCRHQSRQGSSSGRSFFQRQIGLCKPWREHHQHVFSS